MTFRKLSAPLIALAIAALSLPALADSVGVSFAGEADLQTAISEALTAEGHQIVDISEAAEGKKMDSVAAAEIGKATGAAIIVSGKKLGNVIVLKILSTKNDTVIGGTAADSATCVEQVKTLLAENKDKLGE